MTTEQIIHPAFSLLGAAKAREEKQAEAEKQRIAALPKVSLVTKICVEGSKVMSQSVQYVEKE